MTTQIRLMAIAAIGILVFSSCGDSSDESVRSKSDRAWSKVKELGDQAGEKGAEIASSLKEKTSEAQIALGGMRDRVSEYSAEILDETKDLIAAAKAESDAYAALMSDWSREQWAAARRCLSAARPKVITSAKDLGESITEWRQATGQTTSVIAREELLPILNDAGAKIVAGGVAVTDMAGAGIMKLDFSDEAVRNWATETIDLSDLDLNEETEEVIAAQLRGAIVGAASGAQRCPRLLVLIVKVSGKLLTDRNYGPTIKANIVRTSAGVYLKLTTTPTDQMAQELGSYALKSLADGSATEKAVQVLTMAAAGKILERSISAIVAPNDDVLVGSQGIKVLDGETLSISNSVLEEWIRNPSAPSIEVHIRGIDTPNGNSETRSLGSAATKAARDFFEGAESIKLINPTSPVNGRIEAQVLAKINGKWVDWGEHALSRGIGSIDQRFIADLSKQALTRYEQLQSAAKLAKLGGWMDLLK